MSDMIITSEDLRSIMLVVKQIMDKVRPSVTVSEDDMRSITWGSLSLLRKINTNFDSDVYDWLLMMKNLGHPVVSSSEEESKE